MNSLPDLNTEGIDLTPSTKLTIDGGIGGDGAVATGPCLLDDYILPDVVALYRFDKQDAKGGTIYVMDGHRRYLIGLRNPNSPARNPIKVAVEQQHNAEVVVDEISFNQALEIAHKAPKCAGIMFMDDLNKPEQFYILSIREEARNVD